MILALAGCANGSADSAEPAGAPAPASAVPSSAVPTEEPSAGKPTETGSKTLSGTITAGVEPNCLLLDDHLLIFDDAALKSVAKDGASVTVTGRAAQGMMTTCQQGTPFVVSSIRAN
ncbi:hypothetical protein AFR_07735 [Actinoplanes friuliensis DSM 7358]|uniref:Uncharacterized protein n=1 Tax=Actinoplanes friuliensis DSM 7358 TaxID=1246995 RepID=U5VW05_9ACTN|nr:hypothetical protein AFR_07735 [Actinoplanes friuliensis DSM 7358]